MKTIIYDSCPELSARTAELICDIINDKPDSLLCFPAGETAIETYRNLTGLNKAGKVSFSRCRVVGLDEWLGLGMMRKENCFAFLRRHLFDNIDLNESNLCFFNGESIYPEQECTKTDNFIRQYGPIHMMLLGAGMNGHLGLNEPGTPFGLYSHIVELDETTKKMGQKYFSERVSLLKGITLGIKHVMESHNVILQICGAKKSKVVERIINGEVSQEFPASVIGIHKNSYLLLDRDSAGFNKARKNRNSPEL